MPEKHSIEDEGERLLSLVPKESWMCVLDVRGVELSSEEFASKREALMVEGKSQLEVYNRRRVWDRRAVEISGRFSIELVENDIHASDDARDFDRADLSRF